MKFKAVALFLFLLLSQQSSFSQTIEDQIVNLINSGDMVSLNHRFQTTKDSISNPTIKLLGEVFVYTSTNKPLEANKAAGVLLQDHQEHIGMQGITVAVRLLAENMRNMGEYENSANLLRDFLDKIAAFNGLDSLTRLNFENHVKLKVFGNLMKPEIIRPKRDCVIPLSTRGTFEDQMLYVEVEANGEVLPFTFDTGCDAFSTNLITESVAEKLGVRLLDDSVSISGIGAGYAKMGVLDSMKIGDVIYKSVAFTVAKGDDLLSADDLKIANDGKTVYEGIGMDAVLGSVFMKAVGEFHIYPKENKIVIPAEESKLPPSGSNLALLDGQPYLQMFHQDKPLIMHFDTGGGLGLSDRFYRENEEYVLQYGIEDKRGVGGFGGVTEKKKIYKLPSFALRMGNASREIKEIDVFLQSSFSFVTSSDGTVGTDYLRLFDKVVINFNKMFVTVE